MIRLLAIDIDGTLLDSRGRIPDAHRQALGDASAQGVAIALVTGRSFHFTRPIADLLQMPVTMIVNNGAMTYLGTIQYFGGTGSQTLVASGTRNVVLLGGLQPASGTLALNMSGLISSLTGPDGAVL